MADSMLTVLVCEMAVLISAPFEFVDYNQIEEVRRRRAYESYERAAAVVDPWGVA